MRLEQRGWVKRLHFTSNRRREEAHECGKTVRYPKETGCGGFPRCQRQCGRRRNRQRDDRAVRIEAERQSLQNLEPDGVRELLPAAGQGGCHSEEEWRGTDTWRPYGFGPGGSDGGQDGA